MKMRLSSPSWNTWLPLGVILSALSVVPVAGAETRTSLSGFGSIGAGSVLTSHGEFADYDTDWSFDTDSVLGAQLDIVSTQGITFTAQGVARGFDYTDTETDYDPELELLFLAYQASDNLRLRGGLIRTPFFMYSESIEVGYAYPWVRPPVDVYGSIAMSVTHIKGIDGSFYQPIGDALLEWRLVYGNYDTATQTASVEYDLRLEPLMGSTWILSWNEWILRYSLYRVSSTFSSEELSFVQAFYRNLATIDPLFNTLGQNVGGRNQTTIYHVLGLQYDASGWLITSEVDYEPAREKQFAVTLSGAYLSLARQFGKYTPYVLTSYTKSSPSRHLYADLRRSESIIPPGENPLLDLIRQGTLQAYDAVKFSNTRHAIGMRYDLNDHIDLKAELEFFSIDRASSPGQLPDDQKMLTFVMDWVL